MKEIDFSAEKGEKTTPTPEEFAGNFSSLERHVISVADAVLQSDSPNDSPSNSFGDSPNDSPSNSFGDSPNDSPSNSFGDFFGDTIAGIVVLPLPDTLLLAKISQQSHPRFVREGDDLVIKTEAGVVVVEGYFLAAPPPILTTGSGGHLSPALVASFLEQGGELPQKYAFVSVSDSALGWLKKKLGVSEEEVSSIGEIISTEGLVQVTRDEVVMQLKAGDIVLEGDIVSTGEGAEVFMRFTDKMEFRLGEDAHLAIDQYLYDEVSSSGIQALSIIAGAFSYASGLVAQTNPASVRLQTPQGVIGIRGTRILGDIGEGELAVTVLEGRVVLLQDEREVAVLDEAFETLRIVSSDASGGEQRMTTTIASAAEVLETYDLLDGSEQQLHALMRGEPLEDEAVPAEDKVSEEAGEEEAEVALLPSSEEVYVSTPIAEVDKRSFLDKGEREATAEEDAEAIVEKALVVEEEEVVESAGDIGGGGGSDNNPYLDASLSAGELSFGGSSVGGELDFSSGSDVVFDDVTGRVFNHGTNVNLQPQEGQDRFKVTGVVDVTGSDGDDVFTGNAAANKLRGGAGGDILNGNAGDDELYGGAGDDILNGGAGKDFYRFAIGDGTDIVQDNIGDDMVLQFYSSYSITDFADTNNFNRVDNALVITIDKNNGDSITDRITIENAYNDDLNIGTKNAAFSISIEFGSDIASIVVTDIWSALT